MESDDDSKTSRFSSKTSLASVDKASTSQAMDENIQVLNQEILSQLQKNGSKIGCVRERGSQEN